MVVTGRLTTRSWEAEGGERRIGLEVEASSVGLELSRGTATSLRAPQLVTDMDPWLSSGQVDDETGAVLAREPDPAEDDEALTAAA